MELDNFDEFMLDQWTSEDDDSPIALDSDFLEPEFGSVKETITEQLEELFRQIAQSYKLQNLVDTTISIFSLDHYPELIHAIRSMVGDDEVITSNCLMYCILCVLIGPILARIHVSWDDVQWNRHLFNYAEGWVFLPPSMDSSFEAVTRYNRGNGVPFVLDPVKFRDLSCVRKQSAMNVDLASKFKNLAEKATWTNPSWITWNSHQFALILGIEIFDFMKSKIFPYLFGWEGGCGGAPPFNNMYTAAGAIYKFRGGQAKRGIIGLMNDSNRLQRGEISPDQAFFTKNLNLAMSGDAKWAAIRGELEAAKHENVSLGLDYDMNIVEQAEKTIPSALIEKSTTIHPDDAFTGVAMSYLREKGYILTELDLVERVENEHRLKSIWGRIPMQEVEDQIALRKNEYLESFHQRITELSKLRHSESVKGILANLDEPMSPESISIMKEYYIIRIEQALRFNSFIYNERLRVFKYEDVEEYFNRGTAGLKDQFCKSIGAYYRPEIRRAPQFPDEDRSMDEIERWLRSDNLNNLIKQPFPSGIGPDDSRVVRSLSLVIDSYGDAQDGFLVVIISSDRGLIKSAQRLLSHNYPRKVIRVYGLRLYEYLRYSLAGLTPKYKVKHRSRSKNWLQGRIYNPAARSSEIISGPLLQALELEAKFFWQCKSPRLIIEYDYPNINRGLLRFKFNAQSSPPTVTEMSGGFLSANYLKADGKFAIRDIDEVVNLNEFNATLPRTIYPVSTLGDQPLKLYRGIE